MKENNFKEWLDNKINTSPPEWFDPDGNSARATVTRMRKGVFCALVYEHKVYLKDLGYWWSNFEGLRTEIGWFVQIPFIPLFVVFGGFTRTYFRYKSALDDYRKEFEMEQSNETL